MSDDAGYMLMWVIVIIPVIVMFLGVLGLDEG